MFTLFVVHLLGLSLTFYLFHNVGYSSVMASSIVLIIAGVVEHLSISNAGEISTILVISSFVGMSSQNILSSIKTLVVASFIATIVYKFSNDYSGFGGASGTNAFIAVCITYLIFNFSKLKV
ncbi:MAG: hypothetical protein JG767_1997 [Deferribacteraceae bacterium]|nr:hypothetical protein [Deferribacteraceae bacterium]